MVPLESTLKGMIKFKYSLHEMKYSCNTSSIYSKRIINSFFSRTLTLPQSDIKWIPLSPQNPQYLDINTIPEMVSGVPFPVRMDLWESMFPVSGPHQLYF